MKRIMKGVITIIAPLPKTSGECYGAWQVVMAKGEGYGREIYGLAYAMSPTGRLISDRIYVSDDAIDGWKRAASKRRALPLDDFNHDHKNPDEYHTPDPEDDCKVYRSKEKEHLNFAYEANGSEGALLAAFTANHGATMSRAQEALKDPQFTADFESRMKSYFITMFPEWDG